VLIFCTKKSNSEEVAHNLRQNGYSAGLLHGDMGQADRDEVITNFKKKSFPILVATDVAARGLDIPSIKTVVNYDVAKDIDTHVHRIGRTGRAGEKGAAHTLVMSKDVNMAGDLVRNLETADQVVPDELLQLAMKNPRFVKSRSKYNKSQKNVGGTVLGGGMGGANKRLRLGLGATKSASSSSNHPTLSSITSGCGPGGNRAAAVKEALQASYKFRFQAASSNQFSTTSSVAATTKDTPPQTKKRKSRWQD
jgi:ATP-dependent RNA helicase DDX42